MSDKENEAINITKSEEFQTFSKNCKNSNKNEKNTQIALNKENFEFTFKKNLFNEKNKITEKNNEEANNIVNYKDNIKIHSILYENNKFKENKKIFKALFQKKKSIKSEKNNIKTVINNHYNERGYKSINTHNNKNNKIFLRNKLSKNNKKNEKIDSNSALLNNKKENKSHLIQKYTTKYKNNDNSKTKNISNNKNNSFICQTNKCNIFNNNINSNYYISSYKSKINIKRKISAKNININCEHNKNNYNPGVVTVKMQTQKNTSFNNINKKEESKKSNNKKIINNFDKKKSPIHKIDNNILIINNNNNQKSVGKIKIDKGSLSCKNQIRNIYLKEHNNKNGYINYYAYSNMNKAKIICNNKTNSSVIIKKNKTLFNIKNNNNINTSKNSTKKIIKRQVKKKLTPDKKNNFVLFNKNK